MVGIKIDSLINKRAKEFKDYYKLTDFEALSLAFQEKQTKLLEELLKSK